jgi:hypothetical protein
MKQVFEHPCAKIWHKRLGLFLLLFSLAFPAAFAQGGAQWTSSINVGDGDGAPPGPWADWILQVITTQEGNYLGVGFAREDEGGGTHPDVPAYCLVGPNGNLLRDGVVEDNPTTPTSGRLSDVVEASNDSYYAVGGHGTKGILIRINKTTLDVTNTTVDWLPTNIHYTRARFTEISLLPTPQGTRLLCMGRAFYVNGDPNSNDYSSRWVAVFDLSGNMIHDHVFPTSGFNEELSAAQFSTSSGGQIEIFYTGYKMKTEDGGFGQHRRHDADILVGKLTYDPANGTFSEMSVEHNSITQGARDETANAATATGDIFQVSPPMIKDKYAYGPKYIGTSFERNFENCNEPSSANGFYIEDWSDGSEDVPYSLSLTNDKIVVSALLNRLILWENTNDALQGDNEPGVHCSANSCSNFDGDYYLWGEAYLLFFNKSDLSLAKATHLGTWTGGDFIPKMIQTADGGFAVAGTVTGCPEGLDPVTGKEHMALVMVDADGNVISRQHYNGSSNGSCGFAVTQSPDGSILIAGNTETGHEEDFLFIKTTINCDFSGATINPNDGNNYVLQGNETWNTDQVVNANVVVPAGKVLTIEGTNASKITVRFADGKEKFGLANRTSLGIRVEIGGRLTIKSAILTGADCNGNPRMWDGISIAGNPDPTKTQTGTNQGWFTMLSSEIRNARWATVTADVWAGQTAPIVNNYAGTGSQSIVQTSTLFHGGNGGGYVGVYYSKYLNNHRSGIFMKYPHNQNSSKFLQTDFVSDGPLVDVNDMRPPVPNNYNDNEPRGSWAHVSIWSTRVQFSGCDFSGSTGIIPDYRPFGIEGDDPKIVASGTMTDLKVGIECRSPEGSILGNVNANGITFTNTIQSIILRNSVADIIQNCHFNSIPVTGTISGLTPLGIGIAGSRGSLIQNNEFHGTNNSKAYGLVISNTSLYGATVKENKFFNVRSGNQFEGFNPNLDASCNDYTDMGREAWSVVQSGGGGSLANQGSSAPLENKADNEFFDPCGGTTDNHIFSEFGFNYYENLNNPNPANGDCVSDIVNFDAFSSSSPFSCQMPEPPPCWPPDCFLSSFEQSSKSIRDRNIALRGLIHQGFDGDGNDLPARYEDALVVLYSRNQPEDRVILVGSLASMGEYAQAQAELALLPNTGVENTAYKAYMTNFLSGGSGDISAFSEAKYQNALTYLDDANTSAQTMAQTLQLMRDGIYTPFIPIERAESAPRSKANKVEYVQQLATPNPFVNSVSFDLSKLNPEITYTIEVSDWFGRVIWSTTAQGTESVFWDAASSANGQYYFTIRSASERPRSGKLIKISE